MKFCGDPLSPVEVDDPSCTENKTLMGALAATISKYVFFSTDKRYLDEFTEHEEYIIDKYAADLPKLMWKVKI